MGRAAPFPTRGDRFFRGPRNEKNAAGSGRAGGATTRGGRETHPLRVPRRLSVSAMVFS